METPYARNPSRNDAVLLALAALLYAAGVGRYGERLLLALAVSAAAGLATEVAAGLLRRRAIRPLGVVYWVLLPLALPPAFPLWMVGVSSFFATVVCTAFFGGHGRQIASPVAVGWAFASLSFAAAYGFGWALPFPEPAWGFGRYAASVLTIDHPITLLRAYGDVGVGTILWGDFPQTPGNAMPALTLACAALLLVLRAVDVRGVAAFLAAGVGLSVAGAMLLPRQAPPVSSLLVGDFVFAAAWVFGDTRTAARTLGGRWWSGLLAGAAAAAIRTFSNFPCGVFYAVLLGQVFSPILDEAVFAVKYRRRAAA